MSNHQYSASITKSYPVDIRIFISKCLVLIKDFYGIPYDFDEENMLNCFDWGNMYNRQEEYICGDKKEAHIVLERQVFGELQFTDEWEVSSFKLVHFCPPQITDTICFEVICAESFLLTDKGSHSCTIDLQTDSSFLFSEIMQAIQDILALFPHANVEQHRG